MLGFNFFNKNWDIHALNVALGFDPGPRGVFSRIDLDFRDAATGAGSMLLTVNPEYDVVSLPEPATIVLALLGVGGVAIARRRAART